MSGKAPPTWPASALGGRTRYRPDAWRSKQTVGTIWSKSRAGTRSDLRAHGSGMERAPDSSIPSQVSAAAERIRGAARAILLLDYDGTLVPFVERPERARPDRPLLALLGALAARPGLEVHLVSGRPREDLERWFGALPLGLHAEHGYWSRAPGGAWTAAGPVESAWRGPVLALMRAHAARTPGAHVEEKSVGLAWHHRAADPSAGAAQARALERRLLALLADGPAEVLIGDQVVEVRPRGVDKGGVVRRGASAA